MATYDGVDVDTGNRRLVGVDGWGGLLLGLAARGTVVLAESVAPGTGQARVVAQQVLGRFTHGAQGQSGAQALRFVDRGLSYTGLLSEGFLFLVAGKLACGTEKPRQCLEAMRAELGGVLQQKGGRAKAGGLQKQLEVKIRKCLHQTLQAPAGGKLGEAKQNLEDIQVIMSQNIEKILDRVRSWRPSRARRRTSWCIPPSSITRPAS